MASGSREYWATATPFSCIIPLTLLAPATVIVSNVFRGVIFWSTVGFMARIDHIAIFRVGLITACFSNDIVGYTVGSVVVPVSVIRASLRYERQWTHWKGLFLILF
jgi:hypothetical protein